eukprot:g5032.t1
MALTADLASRQVDNFLDANKSSDYMCSTEAIPQSEEDKVNSKYTYVTTFSKPRSVEPIPRAVARVTFYVSGAVDKIKLYYRVENETAVRSGNGAVAFSTEWIDGVIKRKMKMKEFFDCRSDFEMSRWKDIIE